MTIMIKHIFRKKDLKQYKLNLDCQDSSGEGEIPLDIYVSDSQKWRDEWLGCKGNKGDRFKDKDYVFALIDYYPEADSWLFVGIFKILDRTGDHYELRRVPGSKKYEGRLVISFHRNQTMRFGTDDLDEYLDELKVKKILPEPYSGEAFPGYEKINHDFRVMEVIFKQQREGWRDALSSIKGVYLICNKENGKKYVGSAYRDGGIWQRWAEYIGTGHGWNEGLLREITEKGEQGMEYARNNYNFSLLEIMSKDKTEKFIRDRETDWKEILLTRKFGYNEN